MGIWFMSIIIHALLLLLCTALCHEARRVADTSQYRQIDERKRIFVIASTPLSCRQNDPYAPYST